MSETNEAAPVDGGAVAPNPAEPTPATENAPDSGTEQNPQETQPEQPSEEDERERLQKRFDRLTREKYAERRRADAAEARLQEVERRQQPAADPNAPPDPAALEQRIRQEAVRLRQIEDFNARCNEVYEKGKAEDPDFEKALSGFSMLGGLPPVLAEAALETDAPHKVLAHLGRNPEEAETLLRMSPVRMGAALAKLATKVATAPAPPPVSKAPPPIRPITASGSTGSTEPKDADAWAKWFLAERRKR